MQQSQERLQPLLTELRAGGRLPPAMFTVNLVGINAVQKVPDFRFSDHRINSLPDS